MDCRTPSLLALVLVVTCAGCVTSRSGSNTSQSFAGPAGKTVTAAAAPTSTARVVPRKERRGTGSVKMELAFAKMVEREADLPKNKDDLEKQAKLRDDARRAYESVLKMDPNNVEAYRGLGRVYTHLGDYERAFATYQKATTKLPKSAALWHDYGHCHNRRKEWPQAIQCFQKALACEPDNRDVLKELGLTLARAGQFEQALTPLTRASGAAMAHYYVARMQLHLGQDESAKQHLNAALRENPRLNDAQQLLAQLDAGPNAAPAGAAALATRGTLSLQPTGN